MFYLVWYYLCNCFLYKTCVFHHVAVLDVLTDSFDRCLFRVKWQKCFSCLSTLLYPVYLFLSVLTSVFSSNQHLVHRASHLFHPLCTCRHLYYAACRPHAHTQRSKGNIVLTCIRMSVSAFQVGMKRLFNPKLCVNIAVNALCVGWSARYRSTGHTEH